MKIFVFVAFALAVAVADDGCVFDAQVACNNCPYDINFVQYVADYCNISTFYFCEKAADGTIIPHQLSCGPCLGFSNEKWSCSIVLKRQNCPTAPPPVILPIPKTTVTKNFFCINFDGDDRDKTTWYTFEKTQCQLVPTATFYSPDDYYQQGLNASGLALYSNGWPCGVEIPFFQNNAFTQFTFCGFFNFYDVTSDEMGLAFNGFVNDCYPGSINIVLTQSRTVKASVVTKYGPQFEITNSLQVSPWIFHKFCFKYDGKLVTKTLSLTVDGYTETKTYKSILPGDTATKKCNLRLGQTLEAAGGGYYVYNFVGLLDSWCFAPSLQNEQFFFSKT